MATLHALLIGIDDYPKSRLSGCVNDIDAIQQLLLGPRLNIGAAQIRRLAAPLPGTTPDATIAAQPPTLANLRAALEYLGSDAIARGDRVFIYFSGHGARVPVITAGGHRIYHEALVPSDSDPHAGTGLLYDHEINALLADVAQRTTSVTMILDCCHAAGTHRSHLVPRYHAGNWRAPAPATRGDLPSNAPLGSVHNLSVASACQASELAYEDQPRGRVRHGLFTQAFLDAIAAVPGDLHAVRWSAIWEQIRAAQRDHNDLQSPDLTGGRARAVFGGPPHDADAGYPVTASPTGFRVEAGTLADVTEGAELAVYGELPELLPPIGSPQDVQVRVGRLRVATAQLATAEATAIEPFVAPAGARARVVKPGQPAVMPYALVPHDRALAELLGRSPVLRAAPENEATVKLVRDGDRWVLVDARHGVAEPYPVLFALGPAELDRARDVLEHYYAYSRPLRMARNIRTTSSRFELRVLACPERLSPEEAQRADLSEAAIGDGVYEVDAHARVCMRVDNGSLDQLRVTLVNVAASGRVQLIGDEIVDGQSSHLFWAFRQLGSPFEMVPPDGSDHCLDRMVAIGRTALRYDLGFLQLDRSFREVAQRTRDLAGRDFAMGPPAEHWIAAQAAIETRRKR
jgi:hypothetical protein